MGYGCTALMNPFLFFLRSHLKLGSLRQLNLSKGDRGFVLPLVIYDEFCWPIQAIGEEA
jgi:hypothetical protein